MLQRLLLVALTLGLGSVCATLVSAAPDLIPAQALFSDRVGDRIKSDGRGWYVDGEGVVSNFFTTAGEQDWVQFHTSKKPARTVVFNPIEVDSSASILLNAEKPIINVHDLGAVGTTPASRAAVFDTNTSVGKFRFDGLGGSCTVLASKASEDDDTWVVASDPDCDIARLVRLTRTKGQAIEMQLGLYHLPFEVTVMYR
jgi:hypothetical protein